MEESAEAGRALVTSGQLPALDDTLQFLYPESDDDPVLQHGESWLRDPKLHVAVTALGDRIALARGTRLLLAGLTDTRGVGTIPTSLALLLAPAPVRAAGANTEASVGDTVDGRSLLERRESGCVCGCRGLMKSTTGLHGVCI